MKQTLEIMKAISDKNRMRVIAALWRFDELCACQITEFLQVSGATASRHLGILQKAGLVESRKEGRWVYYKLLKPEGSGQLFSWLEHSLSGAHELVDDFHALKEILDVTPEEICRKQRGVECCPN